MKMVDGKLQLFDLKGTKSTWQKEVLGGITTFFAMSYIIITNPGILSQGGTLMPWGAVFIATIIASIIGTLIMGLFADVPYAQAPGMGLNAFFTFTVCFALKFTWQEALTMVFICGIINIIITVTKVRKLIIKAIPRSLQSAISGGIGLFIAYLGLLNVGFISLGNVPGMSTGTSLWNNPTIYVFLIGLIICIVLNCLKVKGAMVITIIATTLIGLIPFDGSTQVTQIGSLSIGSAQYGYMDGFIDAFKELPQTFGVIFTDKGFGSLFNDGVKTLTAIITIFSFSLSDTFDTLGTFIGTGRKSGIFNDEDIDSLEKGKGFKSKMDKALFADSVATSIGAIIGTSNTTTFVESASGIESGARTGLASCVTALCFALSIFFAGPISAVPAAATAPVLVVVGCMMLTNLLDIKWNKLEEAIPAFFATAFMAFCYSISYGIAMGFISYCLIRIAFFIKDTIVYNKAIKNGNTSTKLDEEGNEIALTKPTLGISWILGISTVLFLLNFILLATPLMNK